MEIAREQYLKIEKLNDYFWECINKMRHVSEIRGRIEMVAVIKDFEKEIKAIKEVYELDDLVIDIDLKRIKE